MRRKKPDILESHIVAQSKRFCVEALKLRFSNGEERDYERLKGTGRQSVIVVAMPTPETVLLIREYAAGIHEYHLSLPMGIIEREESGEQAANRELMEETGFGAHSLQYLTTLTLMPGYTGSKTQVVLANDLYEKRLEGDEPEDLEVLTWPINDLHSLLQRDDFNEARAISALFLARNFLITPTLRKT